MHTPLYQLKDVRQTYAGRAVLEIESLNIERGEIFAVLGPSGAGKSTLLRLLNFLESPGAGELYFDGQPIPTPPPLSLLRRVTTVFQRPILLNQTLRENVAYGLRVRGLPVDGSVEATLSRVGLMELAHRAAHTRSLSGGELQRAALARALVLEPEVLLLDEPTANLDPYNVNLIETIVREQNRARGTTIVLVTHNVFQARRMAARAGLLLNGRLVEVAPAAEFFESPRDPRTAAFVKGEMVY
jgi:tungstate transport system ATP-binding protein